MEGWRVGTVADDLMGQVGVQRNECRMTTHSGPDGDGPGSREIKRS